MPGPNKYALDEEHFSQSGVCKERCRVQICYTQEKIAKFSNHMLIRSKACIDNVVFSCAILHKMMMMLNLVNYDGWNDEVSDYDNGADVGRCYGSQSNGS